MKTMEWRFIDKGAWDRGPWDDEPDKLQWQDEATGLPCLIHRGGAGGNLCGYVGVPPGHPWYKRGLDEINADIHGGLTFADSCGEIDPDTGRGICHVAPDEPEPWWIGFDCAHSGDLSPAYLAVYRSHGLPFGQMDIYRSLAYLKAQCAALALQVKAAA